MISTFPTASPEDLAELGIRTKSIRQNPSTASSASKSTELVSKDQDLSSLGLGSQVPPTSSGTKQPYAGDYRPTQEELTPLKLEGYTTCDLFDSPAHLVTTLIPAFREQKKTLHQWQIEQNQELAESYKYATDLNPYKLALCAANGSGKDYLVIAPFVIWSCLTQIRCLTIITSSSGTQLTAQTENYIKALAQRVNDYFGGQKIFHIRQRYIRCNLTGAEVRMFATDEAGKAEGYHPLEPGSKMIIIVNEAKSVAEEIFEALTRCTGYSHWLNVSTPGEPRGSFYDSFCNWPITRHVTTYDCPHLSESQREDDRRKYGEHSPLYRSKHLALFTTIGGEIIISPDITNALLKEPPQLECEVPLQVGIDLAAGGDENCVTIIKGCEVLEEYFFHEVDTTITADKIDEFLTKKGVPKDYEFITADDGGIGHGIIDNLRRKDWVNIKRIHNQFPAYNKDLFGNIGAENWERVKRILEEKLFDISKLSKKTIEQLTTRQRKKADGSSGRLFLESKKTAKAHGRPSPDRADAFILALFGRTIDDFIKAKPKESLYKGNKRNIMDARNLEEWFAEQVVYADYNKRFQEEDKTNKRCFCSLRRAAGYEEN